MNEHPLAPAIGCIDSGLGGLSVLRAIRQQLPSQNLLYIADSQWSPYGNKPPEQITQRLTFLTQHLIKKGAQLVVLACNSATITAIEALRQQFAIPFVGAEPGIKPAVKLTQTGKIGVLATSLSLQGARFAQLVQRYAPQAQLIQRACPELVRLVDEGQANSLLARTAVQKIVDEMQQANVDVVILGCTHYLFFKPLFEALLPQQIRIIDTGEAIARQVSRLAPSCATGLTQLFTTANVSAMQRAGRLVMPELQLPWQLLASRIQ